MCVVSRIMVARPSFAMDIGGGEEGTKWLNTFKIKTNLLDPFVKKPKWVNKKISWSDCKKYDLIVARGSINYLKEWEIRTIPPRLTDKGIFLANSFVRPPSREWTSRHYTNGKQEIGFEKFRLNKRNLIEHEIHIQGIVVDHTFFYYTPNQFKSMLPGVKLIPYGTNSVRLELRGG